MDEFVEVRHLLERSACRPWWTKVALQLVEGPTLVVPGLGDGGSGIDMGCANDGGVKPADTVDRRSRPHGIAPPIERGSKVIALKFSQKTVGEMRLQLLPDFPIQAMHESALSELAAQCARIVQRLASQRWIVQAELGSPCLIGSSQAMLALDRLIEESCAHTRPVMLLCANGNEALQTAIAIHRCGALGDQAFIEVDWENTLESPGNWIERARGGTLFLSSLDNNPIAAQAHLWQQLEQALNRPGPERRGSQGANAQASSAPDWACRLVISRQTQQTTAPNASPIPFGRWNQCDWMFISVPRLSQRKEDIPLLTRTVLDYHGHGAQLRLTEAFEEWCINYNWPGDASQLERIVARIALLTENAQIGADDIEQHAPHLLGEATDIAYTGDHSPQLNGGHCEGTAPARASDAEGTIPEHWVRCVSEQDTRAFALLPAGLNRALQYLGKFYHQNISMTQLAASVHVSASHLRFMFRDSVGMSFKLFLQRIRIAHAKRLLLEIPLRRVNDIALSVGFNDFSHFQKCFRQIVGQTPRDMRRNQLPSFV